MWHLSSASNPTDAQLFAPAHLAAVLLAEVAPSREVAAEKGEWAVCWLLFCCGTTAVVLAACYRQLLGGGGRLRRASDGTKLLGGRQLLDELHLDQPAGKGAFCHVCASAVRKGCLRRWSCSTRSCASASTGCRLLHSRLHAGKWRA